MIRAEVPNSKGTPTHLECVHPKVSQPETHSCPNGSKLPFGSLVGCVFWSLWLTSGKAVVLMHTGDAREMNVLSGGGRRAGCGGPRGLAPGSQPQSPHREGRPKRESGRSPSRPPPPARPPSLFAGGRGAPRTACSAQRHCALSAGASSRPPLGQR